MRKIVALLLMVSIMVSYLHCYADFSYSVSISSLLDSMYDKDEKITTVQEQISNGAQHAAELLVVMARRLDSDNNYEELIDSVVMSQDVNSEKYYDAPERTVNSLRHCVELLVIIGHELDITGHRKIDINKVEIDLSKINIEADLLQQQMYMVYRMADILTIIAYEKGVSEGDISRIQNSLQQHNSSAMDPSEKIVNGLYRSIEFLYSIGTQSDVSGKHNAYFDEVYNIWLDVDNKCNGTSQQAANGMYRIVEMLAGWAKSL